MSSVLDIIWPISSNGRIPLHHQYPLLSAISTIVPEVHASASFGLHAIRGVRVAPGVLALTPLSVVKIRTPLSQLELLLPLSGKRLDVAGCSIRLGTPHLHILTPSTDLQSHLVTIKGYLEASEFAVGIRKQLDSERISQSVNVVVARRRVLRIKQQTIVGFEVRLEGLSDQESLTVQQQGVGGRRHLGCGLFNPCTPSPLNERDQK